MRELALALFLWATSFVPVTAASVDYTAMTTERLVESLALIDRPVPGIGDMANYSEFVAEDGAPAFQMGVLGVPPPTVPPQMQELARRGIAALPILIAHLSDDRPTRLTLGVSPPSGFAFMWAEFGEEYDPRTRSPDGRMEFPFSKPAPPPPDGYVVKVGDVCYVLIGQIVNRRLTAVRYQPTAGIIINSPIERPTLRERVMQDWGGLNSAQFRASLLADLAAADKSYAYAPALRRLRYYFPDDYRALSGSNLEKRKQFEATTQRP